MRAALSLAASLFVTVRKVNLLSRSSSKSLAVRAALAGQADITASPKNCEIVLQDAWC